MSLQMCVEVLFFYRLLLKGVQKGHSTLLQGVINLITVGRK